MSAPEPFAVPGTEKYVWYVWKKFLSEAAARWHRTCWEADTKDAALRLREEPLYHTDFHAGVPQKLVRLTTAFAPCEDTITKPADSYNEWINGVPSPFLLIGAGFGTRVTWLAGRIAWIKGFHDEHTAVVCSFSRTEIADGSRSDAPEDSHMQLEEFVANLPPL